MEIRTRFRGQREGRERSSQPRRGVTTALQHWKKILLLHRMPSNIFEFKKKSAGASRCFLSSVLEQAYGCVCWH